MNRLRVAKSVLCFGVAVTMLSSINTKKLDSATVFKEIGLAGISLSLDKYYADNMEQVIQYASQAQAMSEKSTVALEDVIDAQETEGTTEEVPEENVSKYDNLGISIANDYVNIRKKPDTESKILGKLYKGSSATILAKKGDWVKIESGSVKGYINSEFLAIGFSAEELEDKYGTKWATVNTQTLKVREKKSIESIVLTLIPEEEEFQVLNVYKEWVEILVDEGDEDSATKGFVSKDYVDLRVEFEQAISVKEEQAKLKAAEEARKAEAQAAENLRLAEARRKAAQSNNNSSSSSSNNSSNNSNNSPKNTSKDTTTQSSPVVTGTGSGSDIASYAVKFVGNPYVWGGTSLTNGADCSGFVQTIFSNFGVSVPRTSRSQAVSGSSVSVSSAQAGDLIFYASNGTVNHVAICIGNGQVVHASNRRTGIKISNMYYRQPYCARRVVN